MEIVMKIIGAITLFFYSLGGILYGKAFRNEDVEKKMNSLRIMAIGHISGFILAVLLVFQLIKVLFA